VKLTTHLQLVSRSRKRGSIHPLPHTPGTALPFYLTCSISYGVKMYLDWRNVNKFKFIMKRTVIVHLPWNWKGAEMFPNASYALLQTSAVIFMYRIDTNRYINDRILNRINTCNCLGYMKENRICMYGLYILLQNRNYETYLQTLISFQACKNTCRKNIILWQWIIENKKWWQMTDKSRMRFMTVKEMKKLWENYKYHK
jgi:hypothetical protein